MFSIQGTKLNGAKPIKVKKKHEIQISLFFGKEKTSKRFDKTRYHPDISETHTDSSLLIDKNYKDNRTPDHGSPATTTPMCLSKTPTPYLIKKNHKFSIQRYEFELPVDRGIHNSSYFDEMKESAHSKSCIHRKALKTQEFGMQFHKTEKRTRNNKYFMKEPSMNLPAIANTRKKKKRFVHKITLLEALS